MALDPYPAMMQDGSATFRRGQAAMHMRAGRRESVESIAGARAWRNARRVRCRTVRMPASSSEDSAELLNSLVSYAGTYRIEGNEWITSVQVAWKPDWVNTEQRRQFEIKDNRLRVLTTWRIMPNWADKGLQRSILTFVKTN